MTDFLYQYLGAFVLSGLASVFGRTAGLWMSWIITLLSLSFVAMLLTAGMAVGGTGKALLAFGLFVPLSVWLGYFVGARFRKEEYDPKDL